MDRSLRALVALLCCWLPAPWLAALQPVPLPASPPSEQVIVKFVADSEPGRAIAAAMAHGLEGSAEIAALAETFSRELEIPVRIERLTSGQELLMALDLAALNARLRRYFEAHDQVLRVRPLDVVGSSERLYSRPGVRLELRPGSPSHRALADSRAAKVEDPALRALTEDASQALGLPLSATAAATLEVTLDPEALTQTLLQRLSGRADVEYAEVNRLVPPLDGAGESPAP